MIIWISIINPENYSQYRTFLANMETYAHILQYVFVPSFPRQKKCAMSWAVAFGTVRVIVGSLTNTGTWALTSATEWRFLAFFVLCALTDASFAAVSFLDFDGLTVERVVARLLDFIVFERVFAR
jgi:hypothetical protein